MPSFELVPEPTGEAGRITPRVRDVDGRRAGARPLRRRGPPRARDHDVEADGRQGAAGRERATLLAVRHERRRCPHLAALPTHDGRPSVRGRAEDR